MSAPRLIAEHVERYRYASTFVGGRCVLDIASGVGYGGPILLEAGASRVIAVDIDADAARQSFRDAVAQQHVVRADASTLPLGDASVDACVSVETIEHLPRVEAFVAEVARVLTPRSPFVLTTPNRLSTLIPHDNPFHVREFSPLEVAELLEERFRILHWAGQYIPRGGWRDAIRSWLAVSSAARRMKRAVPARLRNAGGSIVSGSPIVVEAAGPNGLKPVTIVVMAERR